VLGKPIVLNETIHHRRRSTPGIVTPFARRICCAVSDGGRSQTVVTRFGISSHRRPTETRRHVGQARGISTGSSPDCDRNIRPLTPLTPATIVEWHGARGSVSPF
jgi:hypothetical protein